MEAFPASPSKIPPPDVSEVLEEAGSLGIQFRGATYCGTLISVDSKGNEQRQVKNLQTLEVPKGSKAQQQYKQLFISYYITVRRGHLEWQILRRYSSLKAMAKRLEKQGYKERG